MVDNILMLFISCIVGAAAYFLKRLIDDLDEFKKETKVDIKDLKKEVLRIGLGQAQLRDNVHDFELEIKGKIMEAMREKHNYEDWVKFSNRLDQALKVIEDKAQNIKQIEEKFKESYGKVIVYEEKVDRLFNVLKKIEGTRKG